MIIYKILILIGCFIIGYIFGSIPNGVIIGELFYNVDPREYGSKNTGGTNVGRVLGKGPGLLVITLDALKIAIPFLTAFILFTHVESIVNFMSGGNLEVNVFGYGNTLCELAYYLVALGAFIGHPFSVFINFKGGKLVACYVGYALTQFWVSLPFFAPIYFIVKHKTKITAIASIFMVGACFLYSWIVYIIFATVGPEISNYLTMFGIGPKMCIYNPIVCTVAYILLIYRHKDNLLRIKNGTEFTTDDDKK